MFVVDVDVVVYDVQLFLSLLDLLNTQVMKLTSEFTASDNISGIIGVRD